MASSGCGNWQEAWDSLCIRSPMRQNGPPAGIGILTLAREEHLDEASGLVADNSQSAAAPVPLSADPTTSCKICSAICPLFDVVDFHKSCNEGRLPVSGRPVYYYRCPNCGFLFTRSFDRWKPEEFSQFVYNQEYAAVDPEYSGARAKRNSANFLSMFGNRLQSLRLLDFGGGSGVFAACLRESGCSAESFDPFDGSSAPPTDGQRFDIVTAFEVFEHVVDPTRCLQDIDRLLKPDGLLAISTRVNDGKEGLQQIGQRLNWWYASPRNGHISLHSKRSLTLLLQQAGLHRASWGDDLHFGFRQVPAFAAHLIARA